MISNNNMTPAVQGTGLSDKEMEICDSFVYIPQSGPGTASLNVTVAASIVLHQFAGKLANGFAFCQSSTTTSSFPLE
jgi:tRNA C32,U32 (ribose-2'-O)-methylase TrmJ